MPPTRAHTQPALTRADLALLAAVLLLALAVADVLAGGALAGLLFGGGWAWPTTTDLPRTVLGLLAQPGVPAAAYPPPLRALVPGPGAYWGTTAALTPSDPSPLRSPAPTCTGGGPGPGWPAAQTSARR